MRHRGGADACRFAAAGGTGAGAGAPSLTPAREGARTCEVALRHTDAFTLCGLAHLT